MKAVTREEFQNSPRNQMEWKNSPDLFNDYVHLEECPWAMKQILLRYGWFFDDDYFYWLPRSRPS